MSTYEIEFPDDVADIGRDLLDADYLLVNKAKAQFERLRRFIGGATETITTSATIAASTGVVIITPAGPTAVTLTLPDISSGDPKILYVHRTQAPGGTTFARSGTDTIWDDVNATAVTSYVPRDGTQSRAAWLLFGAAGMWRVWRISSPSELDTAVASIGSDDGSTASSIWEAIRGGAGRGFALYSAPPQSIAQNVEVATLYTSGGTYTLPPQPVTGYAKILTIQQLAGSYYDLTCDAGDVAPTIDGAGTVSYGSPDSTIYRVLLSIGAGWTTIETRRDPVTRDISGASATLASAPDNRITYAAALCALAAPSDQTLWAIGESRRVTKANASAFAITLAPPSGGSINGGAVDAAMTLPGSTRAASATAGYPTWTITRTGALSYVVTGGEVRYDTSGNVDLGAGNLATSGTVDGRDVSVDGAKLDLITSGSWVPTFGTFTNLDSVTNIQSDYIRVGTRVMCFCTWAVDPTASGAIQFNFSLPIASNFTTTSQLVGNAGVNAVAVAMYGDIAADQGVVNYGGNTSTTVANYRAIFGYDIV